MSQTLTQAKKATNHTCRRAGMHAHPGSQVCGLGVFPPLTGKEGGFTSHREGGAGLPYVGRRGVGFAWVGCWVAQMTMCARYVCVS